MEDAQVNRQALAAYLERVSGRWQLEKALLGTRGPDYVVLLVSPTFDGISWLDRVYQASVLWDALEMGADADIHCYTPIEFERKRASLPLVRQVAERGIDLLALEP